MLQTLLLRFHSLLAISLLLGFLIFPAVSFGAPKEGEMIKNITFKDMSNKTHRLAEYRGKWLYINFWAGYCSICSKEIPTLMRFQNNNRSKVTVLGINYGAETQQKIKAAMKRYGFNYSIVPDQTIISRYFNDVRGTPTTIIVSPRGQIVAKSVGRQSYKELMMHIGSEKNTRTVRIWDGDFSN